MQTTIALAFFDILGTSESIRQGEYNKVYDFYSYMVKLCSEEEIPLSFPSLPGSIKKDVETVLMFPMKHAFFSDTFIVWVEYKPVFMMSLAGFYEKCMRIFTEAIKRGIPLRGAISRGDAIMDDDNKLYLGKPLVEAARAESCQNWLGIALTASLQESSLSEAWSLLPYDDHIKTDKAKQYQEPLFTSAVLDWPKLWRNTEKDEVGPYIEKMNINEKFSSYYENTIKFVRYSAENDDYWDDKLPHPKFSPKIVLYD